jgi:hypothetical protein
MGIHDLPSTYDDLDYFNRAYDRQHVRFADSNQQVAKYSAIFHPGDRPTFCRSSHPQLSPGL